MYEWRESVMVSFPSSLVVTCFLLYCCLEMVREKRGGREAKEKMHGLKV